MKYNLTRITILLTAIFILSVQRSQAQDQPEASFQVFYDELSPYGQWIQDERYGYAWIPDVEVDFRPYCSNGYWLMTSYGNTWYSMYPWGWAPFHYGRWTYDIFYGWVWIPGYEWGPAWVYWHYWNGYYGWAPLGPWFTVTITFTDYSCPDDWWFFVSCHQLYHRYPNYHPRRKFNVAQSTIVRNIKVNDRVAHITGPLAEEVKQFTGKEPVVYTLVDVNSSSGVKIHGNKLQLYKPHLTPGDAQLTRPKVTTPAKNAIGEAVPVRSNEGHRPAFHQQQMPASRTPSADRKSPVHETRPVKQAPIERPHPKTEPRPTRRTQPQHTPDSRPTQRPETRPVQHRQPTQRTEPVQPQRTERPPVQRTEPRREQPQRQRK